LEGTKTGYGVEYTYKTKKGRTKIYGGKVIENVCQALARCIIAEQMLKIAKKYRPVLTVHDSVVVCVPKESAKAGQEYIEACMRYVPDWAEGLPLDCESGVAKAYGDCE
jgi:DNA polymerase